jgi:hypothetical protein
VAVRDDVSRLEFTEETALRPPEIRAAGQRAASAARRYMRTTIAESFANATSVRYLATGPGGLVRQMSLLLTWDEGAVRRPVRLQVEEYQVEQSSFLFVPVGPKTVPALVSARRFVAALRSELTGRPVPDLPPPRRRPAAGNRPAVARF